MQNVSIVRWGAILLKLHKIQNVVGKQLGLQEMPKHVRYDVDVIVA